MGIRIQKKEHKGVERCGLVFEDVPTIFNKFRGEIIRTRLSVLSMVCGFLFTSLMRITDKISYLPFPTPSKKEKENHIIKEKVWVECARVHRTMMGCKKACAKERIIYDVKIRNKFLTAAKWERAQALSWRECPVSSNLQKLNTYRGKILESFGKTRNIKLEKITIDQIKCTLSGK